MDLVKLSHQLFAENKMYQNSKNDFKMIRKELFLTVCKQNWVHKCTPIPELHHRFLVTKFDH